MKTITLAGGIVCPAIPSFYSKPQQMTDALKTVIYRVLNLAGFENDQYRWAE
jgi:4-hydroxy-3-polyprenylbenzoate decarboxylase